jgi:hypothetical protein
MVGLVVVLSERAGMVVLHSKTDRRGVPRISKVSRFNL